MMRAIAEALALLALMLALGLSWRDDSMCAGVDFTMPCATDTECACIHGGNGDPEPLSEEE